MSKWQDQPRKLALTITLNNNTYDKIAEDQRTQGDDAATTATMSRAASRFFEDRANGAILISAPNMKRLDAAVGEVSNDTQLVEKVEKAMGREDGLHTMRVAIEPAMWPALEEFARVQGRSPEDILSDTAHKIIMDSLAFYLNQQTWEPVIYLTEKEAVKLEKKLGKRRFTGADILKLIEAQEKQEMLA